MDQPARTERRHSRASRGECKTNADTQLSMGWRHLGARVGWAVARRVIIGKQGRHACAWTVEHAEARHPR